VSLSHHRPAPLPADGAQERVAPLLHWDDASLASVADKIADACRAWLREWNWFGIAAVTSARDTPAATPWTRTGDELVAFPVHFASDGGDRAMRAWLACPPGRVTSHILQPVRLIGHQVFGHAVSTDPDSIAAEMSQAALDDLVRGLRGVLGVEAVPERFDLAAVATTLPDEAFRLWSGGVRVGLPGFADLALYLDGAAVAGLVPAKQAVPVSAKAPLTPLLDAAREHTVAIQARLHGVELTIGQLKSLQVGDVVVLPHALEEPLQIVASSGSTVCHAYLGRSGSQRALEVVPCHRAERKA